MRVVCIGAGAIGGYVGGHLAAAGHAVCFVARGALVETLRAQGLRLTRAPGMPAETIRIEVATAASAALKADAIIVAVKAYDTEAVVEQLHTAGKTLPPILCLQNGVDGEAALAAAVGAERVIAGTVTTPVSVPAPGAVAVEKPRGMGVALGHPMSAPLAEALNAAGIRTRLYPSAGSMKWSKLLTNLLGNATAAIVDWPVRNVFAEPGLFALEARSQRECLGVMRALGFEVVDLPGVPVRPLTWAVTALPAALARPLLARVVGSGRGGKPPSLHMDLQAGRARTEAEWLHGAVARHGAKVGVPAPVNAMLAETVEALAAGRLEWEEFRGKPEALAARLS